MNVRSTYVTYKKTFSKSLIQQGLYERQKSHEEGKRVNRKVVHMHVQSSPLTWLNKQSATCSVPV